MMDWKKKKKKDDGLNTCNYIYLSLKSYYNDSKEDFKGITANRTKKRRWGDGNNILEKQSFTDKKLSRSEKAKP